jgi:hypothetical protein
MAVISLLLVATQIIFFVQSTLLLPEVMVAWLSLLSLYNYATQRHLFTFLSCTALMLTKESGLTMGMVLGIHAVWNMFNKEEPIKNRVMNLASIAGASLVIGLFFLLQKKLNGWYLFPEHTGLIDLSWKMFKGKMRFCIEIIFAHQYRLFTFGLLIPASIMTAILKRNASYILPAILGIVLLVIGGDYLGILTRRLLLPAALVLFFYTFYRLLKQNSDNKNSSRFIYLSIFFFAAYLSFSCLNFFTNRYLFSILVVALILAGYCIDIFLSGTKQIMTYITIAVISIVSGLAFKNNTGAGDVDLSIYSSMEVQEDIVNYLEQQHLYDRYISAHSSLQREHLTKPLTGFLHSPKVFGRVNYCIAPTTEFVIIDNIEVDTTLNIEQLRSDFTPVKRFEKGEVWIELLQRKANHGVDSSTYRPKL